MPIDDYIKSQKKLQEEYDLKEDIFIKPLTECRFKIIEDGDLHFLEYIKPCTGEKETCIILKNGEKPYILNNDNYSIVFAIECVKVAFIFDNKMRID